MTKREKRKDLEKQMYDRAFELRQLSGKGWSRQQLMTDPKWSELNNELKKLYPTL